MTTALIDADGPAHRAAHVAPGDPHAAGGLAVSMVERAARAINATRVILAFSCLRADCFRRDVDPAYKVSRADPTPAVAASLAGAFANLRSTFPIVRDLPRLEADDVIGLLATCPGMAGERVIVADDRDLLQLPGRHYRPTKGEWVDVSGAEAERAVPGRPCWSVARGDRRARAAEVRAG